MDYRSGALDSLIQGGRLSIISNETLRLQLALLPEEYANLNRLEKQTQDSLQAHLVPFITENTFFPQVALQWVKGRPGVGGGTDQFPVSYPERPETDHRPIFRDSRFLGMLVWQKGANDDVIYTYQILKPTLVSIIESIDAETG